MKKILPETPIPMGDNLTVGDFWSWAYSDILSNANRGVFAEFLIGTALEAVKNCRVEWDGYDLDYRGYGIEVKSAAYLQSWHQEKLSTIRFDIAERSSSWDPKTNAYHQEKKRYADCYAFCHYAQTDPD